MCFPKKIYFQSRPDSFTLVEVMLVVAIISLLATIAVTVSMTAKKRATSIRIQAELQQIKPQAVLIKNDTDSYVDLCDISNTLNDSNYNLKLIEDDVRMKSGADVICYANKDAYCVQASLLPNGAYCIDSVGYGGAEKTCIDTNFDCE